MTEPKRKHSKGRRNRRRMQIKTPIPVTVKCQYCKADKLSHRKCPNCGRYR